MTPSGPYHVHYSGRLQDRVRDLVARGVAAEIGQRVVNALQFVEGHLTLDPTVWGDLTFRYRRMRLDVYQRIHDGIYVVYAVDEEARRVWITRLYPIHDPDEPSS